MRKLSRTELFVLFCIWISGPAAAVATDSHLVSMKYATDWVIALAFLGASLYVATSVTVNALALAGRIRGKASGA